MQISNETALARSGYLSGSARPFLVGVDEEYGDARITVHAARWEMSRKEARDMRRQIETEGIFSRCRVRRHGAFGLDTASSLEAFLTPFSHDQILYDPTGSFDRARDLVSFAQVVRQRLGSNVRALQWQGRDGTIFVVLDQTRLFKGGKARRSDLVAIESFLRKTLNQTCGASARDAVKGVRISFSAPPVPATPIDRASEPNTPGPLSRIRTSAVMSALAALLVGIGLVGMASAGKNTDAPSGKPPLARGIG